jgi:phenylalanine-4-hydroxylase
MNAMPALITPGDFAVFLFAAAIPVAYVLFIRRLPAHRGQPTPDDLHEPQGHAH